jgi:hypothetical protein
MDDPDICTFALPSASRLNRSWTLSALVYAYNARQQAVQAARLMMDIIAPSLSHPRPIEKSFEFRTPIHVACLIYVQLDLILR